MESQLIGSRIRFFEKIRWKIQYRELAKNFDDKYKNILERISSGDISVENFKALVICDRQKELFSRGEYQPKCNSEFECKNFWKCYKSIKMNNENTKKWLK